MRWSGGPGTNKHLRTTGVPLSDPGNGVKTYFLNSGPVVPKGSLSCIHSSMSTYFVPGAMLSTRDTVVKRQTQVPALKELLLWRGDTHGTNKAINPNAPGGKRGSRGNQSGHMRKTCPPQELVIKYYFLSTGYFHQAYHTESSLPSNSSRWVLLLSPFPR